MKRTLFVESEDSDIVSSTYKLSDFESHLTSLSFRFFPPLYSENICFTDLAE